VPLGIEWPDQKERFARLREAAEIIRRLWTEERVTHDGTFFRTRSATIYDRPPVPLPLYVAASGPAAARLAGRIADRFICTSGTGLSLYSETLLPNVRESAQKAGRDPSRIDLTIEMRVSFAHDRHRALEDPRHWAALALSPEEKTGVDDP